MRESEKFISCACADKINMKNSLIIFILGGSLIPPISKTGGIDTPSRTGTVWQAVSILGSPMVKKCMSSDMCW